MAKILLIDDDEAFRAMVRELLLSFGHEVIEASNGRLGLELFIAKGADLVITDIIMPEQEGLGLMMQLRKKVKIIAMSGGLRQSADEVLHTAKLMGASKILEKPFSAAALKAAVSELTEGPQACLPQSVPG